jgi:type I restriction enzyme, S subunit
MIPEGWIEKTFSELIDDGVILSIQDGNHGGNHPKSKDFVSYGIPFIMANNIVDGEVDLIKCKYISPLQARNLRIGFAKIDDVLLTHKGSVGLTAIVPAVDPYIMLTPQVTYYRIQKNSSKLINHFLYYFFQSPSYQELIDQYSKQSTRAYIGITAQKKLSILLPPLPEQKKIADILTSVDQAIQANQKVIDQSEKVKQGLLQELLTKGIGRPDLPEGVIPDGWETQELASIARINMGQSPKSASYNDIGEGLHLIQGNADIKNRVSTPRIWTSEPTKTCDINDILMTVRAPVGAIAISKHRACIGRGVCSIRGKKIANNFLYQFLLSFESKWKNLEQGSTFTAVDSKAVKELKILLPPLLEQKEIASILSSVDESIKKAKDKKSQLEQVKKGLMQDLLTGKVRVKV